VTHPNFMRAPILSGRVLRVRTGVFGLIAATLIGTTPAAFGQSQPQPSARPAISVIRVPDENTLARLVWSTMVALDNANRTENYSVLNSLGTTAFKRRNSPAQLSNNFRDLRANRVDIGRAILSSPTYYIPPQITSQGHLRLRGGFDFRPNSIRFDLLYSLEDGGWRITAMSVVEMDANAPK